MNIEKIRKLLGTEASGNRYEEVEDDFRLGIILLIKYLYQNKILIKDQYWSASYPLVFADAHSLGFKKEFLWGFHIDELTTALGKNKMSRWIKKCKAEDLSNGWHYLTD